MKVHNSSFEEEIEKNGILYYSCKGDSMNPLIKQNKDIVVIEKINRKLKKYDIPLYKRNDGQYVLHRILKVRKNDYVMCGDNRYKKEYGITDKNIIGVLTGIIKEENRVDLNKFKYKLYSHIWCDFFYIRAFILRLKKIIRS